MSGEFDALYTRSVLLDRPAWYFRLAETSGTAAAEYAGNCGGGTYSGSVTLNNRAKPTNLGGNAPHFNATGSTEGKVVLGYKALPSAFSFDMLVWPAASQPDALPTILAQAEYYAAATDRFPFALVFDPATSKFRMRLASNNDYTLDLDLFSAVVSTDQWHYVGGVVRSSGQCELYVDGNSAVTGTLSLALASAGFEWIIACQQESSAGTDASGFSGSAADVAMYARALSADSFAERYLIALGAQKTISGVVRDDTGAVAARTVRAHRRAAAGTQRAGELIGTTTSSASDGTYTLRTPFTDVHDVVFQDDDAGTQYDDLVLARITPG